MTPGPQAQVALVAMDPHTGEIKALVGGRNYAMSQLNHALAKRPTLALQDVGKTAAPAKP